MANAFRPAYWQQIATAPKTRANMDLWVRRSDGFEYREPDAHYANGCWRDINGTIINGVPTHWHRYPAPETK